MTPEIEKMFDESKPLSEIDTDAFVDAFADGLKSTDEERNELNNQTDYSPIVDCGMWCNPKCPHLNSDYEPDFWRCKLTPDGENLEDDGNPIASCC